MKKLLTIAALASAAAAYGAASVDVGTVGVTKISTTTKNTIVVTSYNELDGSGSGRMAVSNIVKTATLPVGTRLYVLSSSVYEGYELKYVSGNTGPMYWDRDVNYTVGANGALSGGAASPSTSVPSLTVGNGFWISLPDAESYSKDIYVYGKPPTQTNVVVEAGARVLVGNPKQEDARPTIAGKKGDKVLVFEGSSNWPTTYTSDGTGWRDPKTRSYVANLPLIAAGTGFWYLSNGSSVTIQW